MVQQRQTEDDALFHFLATYLSQRHFQSSRNHNSMNLDAFEAHKTPTTTSQLLYARYNQSVIQLITMPTNMNNVSPASPPSRAATDAPRGPSLASCFRRKGPAMRRSHNLRALDAFTPHPRRSSNTSCDSSNSSPSVEDTYLGDAYGYFVDTSDEQ